MFIKQTIARIAALGCGLACMVAPLHAAEDMTPEAAHAGLVAGTMTLVDIRTPAEWRETGIPEGAAALDMKSPLFLSKLDALVEGDKTRPIALICRSGGRSAFIAKALESMGYTNIHDVSEGMSGSSKGPGWAEWGLPVTAPPETVALAEETPVVTQ